MQKGKVITLEQLHDSLEFLNSDPFARFTEVSKQFNTPEPGDPEAVEAEPEGSAGAD